MKRYFRSLIVWRSRRSILGKADGEWRGWIYDGRIDILKSFITSLAFLVSFIVGAERFSVAENWGDPHSPTVVDIDQVWTGAPIGFAALDHAGSIYIGYVDAQRWLGIARVDLRTRQVSHVRLPHQFFGWDSHNFISMGFDFTGTLHVTADMHASPLVYFQGRPPYSAHSFSRARMTGKDESRVTGPIFFRPADGSLMFIYRSGGSGNGAWRVNKWDGFRWSVFVGLPELFSAKWAHAPVSAYPSRFVAGPGHRISIAVIWRRSPDVASNFCISYVQSRDFLHWTDLRGKRLTVPLGPEPSSVVTDTGQNAGLLNSPGLAVDPEGRPTIAFTKYAPNGNNAIYVARAELHSWVIHEIAVAPRRTQFAGFGSIENAIPVSPLSFDSAGRPDITYHLPGEGRVTKQLDPVTLKPVKTVPSPMPLPQTLIEERSLGLVNASYHAINVETDYGSAELARLEWVTQGPNRDHPRACSFTQPKACSPPPSMLRLVLP